LHTRIQLLARQFDDGDLTRTRAQIEALTSDTRVLGEVIEDLLASASLTSERAPKDRVDVVAVVEAVADSMNQHCETAGVRLLVDTSAGAAPDEVVVLGSRSALRRAVTSLVDNALAHEHSGGTIVIAVRRDDHVAVIEVRDDGVGVDPAAMDTLFDRFSHGHAHTAAGDRRRYGIGLALVRETAHAHGGHVAVARTPGGGATFTLTMPVAAERSQ
jgi:signal transduction histidine kinase